MEFHDIVLDGKPLRIWNRQGAGQVAPQQRQPLHHRYDAEQWVQRVLQRKSAGTPNRLVQTRRPERHIGGCPHRCLSVVS
ncbi:MAG: hypothetical protein R3F38_15445 [Gammaproteobacteria bacterium]